MVEKRILKGYWDCPYCETKGIDGLLDMCPECHRQKSKETKCYMKQGVREYVTAEQLSKAGISEEECDGNHKDWVCNYCDMLNNYSNTKCEFCHSDRAEATHEYGMEKLDDSSDESEESVVGEFATTEEFVGALEAILMRSDTQYGSNRYFEPSEPARNKVARGKMSNSLKGVIAAVVMLLAFALPLAFMLWPVKEEVTVAGVSWNRCVTVEEERTVKEDGWSVPSGGRVYDEKREIKTYVQVIDHYETVEELKSREVISHYETVTEVKTRQVISHYETEYDYYDNGNGTFSEIARQTPVYTTETYTESHQEPVYTTEWYTETRQEPVYRQDPVYDTKYYYEIERWFDEAEYETSGNDFNAYWSDEYELSENQRDTQRKESYMVIYDNGDKKEVAYEVWMDTEIGDKIILVKNRLGGIYSEEKVDANIEAVAN